MKAGKEIGLPSPGLVVILIGQDLASQVYIKSKRKACDEVEFLSKLYDLPENNPEQTLLDLTDTLNQAIKKLICILSMQYSSNS